MLRPGTSEPVSAPALTMSMTLRSMQRTATCSLIFVPLSQHVLWQGPTSARKLTALKLALTLRGSYFAIEIANSTLTEAALPEEQVEAEAAAAAYCHRQITSAGNSSSWGAPDWLCRPAVVAAVVVAAAECPVAELCSGSP